MARIKMIATTEKYQNLIGDSQNFCEENDCAVKAVALVCDVNYGTAHAACKEAGRKFRRGMNRIDMLVAVNALGRKAVLVPPVYFIYERYGWRRPAGYYEVSQTFAHRHVTSHHPARFPKAWKDGHNYLIFTKRHVLAVIDGVAHDWAVNKALRAESIYRILPEGE